MFVIIKKILLCLIFFFSLSGCLNFLQEGIHRKAPEYYQPYKEQVKIVSGIIRDECVRQINELDDVFGVIRSTTYPRRTAYSVTPEYLIETEMGVVKLSVYRESYGYDKYNTKFILFNGRLTLVGEIPRDIYYKEKEEMEKYLEELLEKIVEKCD